MMISLACVVARLGENIMPGENPYTAVHCDNDFRSCKKLDWNIQSIRPTMKDKKDKMVVGTVYLYYGEYLYINEPYQGPCYAVINSEGIIQRGQLKFALDKSDPQNIGKLLANGRSLHLLSVAPSDFEQYKNSYLFINEKRLIYVDQNGKSEDVTIDDMSLFKSKLKGINHKKETEIKLDSEMLDGLIKSNGGHTLPLNEVFKAINTSIEYLKADFKKLDEKNQFLYLKNLDEQYRFLLADFKAELEIRHAYNRTLVKAGSLTQDLCDEFIEDADNFLKSIEDAVTPDFHKGSIISQLPKVGSVLSYKDPTGEKIKLLNQALMRGRMALEVPQTDADRALYQDNLKEMKILSKDISGHGSKKMLLVGAAMFALVICMAFAGPSMGMSLLIPAAGAAIFGAILTLGMPMPATASIFGMVGLVSLFYGIEKGAASGLSNLEETAKETAEEVQKLSPR